jgi:hypothetical protein
MLWLRISHSALSATTASSDVRELLRLMDKDRNGSVSKDEFMQFMSQTFDRLDVNKSGQLESKEALSTAFPFRVRTNAAAKVQQFLRMMDIFRGSRHASFDTYQHFIVSYVMQRELATRKVKRKCPPPPTEAQRFYCSSASLLQKALWPQATPAPPLARATETASPLHFLPANMDTPLPTYVPAARGRNTMGLYVNCGREADACWVSLSGLAARDYWFSAHRRADECW